MDILSVAAIRLPCSWCGESYEVPLRDILLSHKIMHEGCPVAEETECPPVFQSRLASEWAVKTLEQAWRRLERRAAADGGELLLIGPSTEYSVETKKAAKRSKAGRSKPSRGRAA